MSSCHSPLTLKQEEIEFVKGFVEEGAEHIEAIEAAVLAVEGVPEDTAKINDLFRPFHTIKGIAGFLNLRDINCLTHEVETLLDQARKGERKITPGLIDVVFDVVDTLRVQISSVGEWMTNPQGESVPQPPVSGMIDKLRRLVSSRLDPGVREAGPGSTAQKTGENLVEQGVVPQEVVDFALERQQAAGQAKKLGETLVDMKAATPRQVSQAIRPQAQARVNAATGPAAGQKTLGDQSLRIDTAKLDVLVDMVGELVIAQTLVDANPQVAAASTLAKDVTQVTKIVREVQEVAMAMRMVPIGPTFQKMARLVGDVSRKAGKQVNLTISGEDTELDKTVIQQIGDPLVHMVRNAVDHGIEPPEERRAAGKPEIGEVHLAARHAGGNIVIEISDDGKGLDAPALIHKAIEKGIVQPDEELTDQQAYGLIFAAGFSLAKQVTDISGRGVGMDVVKRNIDQLRGKVDISSEKGHGSTFSIRLPLTLAIIDGMIIRVGRERFIIPTIAIEQSLRPLPEQITTVQQRGEVVKVRGQLVPLVQLGELFGLTGRLIPSEAMVVIAQCEGRQIGLVVEELIGQQQVVIKTLGERFKQLRGISGAAILGDGRVGLILEMPGLAAAHQAQVTSSDPPARANRGTETGQHPIEDQADSTEQKTPHASIQCVPEPVAT
ncbi:MAG: chemotaxis protein CheA [Planctomycetes bacterium]|nr:chemotaxis protein CheA [Planctomycetota bacterium]